MPCCSKIYKERRLVVTTASGKFTFAEGVANEDRLYADPDFDPSFDHLIDGRHVTKAEISATELSSLARRSRFSPKARQALVVTSTVLYGLARMFQAYMEVSRSSESIAVFKELEKAKEWLGVTGELWRFRPCEESLFSAYAIVCPHRVLCVRS